ncbi:unnamed protein product [Rotaria sordida]|nr:unnamed protein product [Rotaria sordida]
MLQMVDTNDPLQEASLLSFASVRAPIGMIKVTQENFEALMSLTNLISTGENVRKRILKEEEFSNIELHIFEEHPMLRRTTIEYLDYIKDLILKAKERKRLNDLIEENQIICEKSINEMKNDQLANEKV